MPDQTVLTPDCSSCAALCCVVFAFDRSESFAIDKDACEVCPNLDDHDRCRIFADREDLGFKGCIAYDCRGAGQRVTQEVFHGASWRENPALKEPMGAALSVMRRIHDLLLLLETAGKMTLAEKEAFALAQLQVKVDPDGAWTEERLREFPIEEITADVNGFLRSLSHHVSSTR